VIDLYIFMRHQDARYAQHHFLDPAARAITRLGLHEKVRGLEVRNVFCEPDILLSDQEIALLRSRQRDGAGLIVKSDFEAWRAKLRLATARRET
jgi:hypothetical protein